MHFIKNLICILICCYLSACSQKAIQLNETLRLAVQGYEDATLTADEILNIPYASIYVKLGDGPRVFMVLAFAEDGLLKWISADKRMLVTQNGRVIKSIGLPGTNLDGLSSSLPDPLSLNLLLERTPKTWQLTADYSPGFDYGHLYHSKFELMSRETLSTLGEDVSTSKYIESMTGKDGEAFHNEFWIDDKGEVVKSLQRINADSPTVEMTILRRYQP